jgi:membrane-associated phospholipid phosphatase
MKRLKNYKHAAIIPLYGIFYICSFIYLEHRDVKPKIIHCTLDDYIPFCEYFIIPYVLWYLFIAGTLFYFAFGCKHRNEFWKLTGVWITGMTVFLITSYVYPNGQDLRPVLQDGNLFVQAVKILYRLDTPTNILPSMHVFNAVACCIAICRNQQCQKHRAVILGTQILTVLIVLATMFLKQHTVIDVLLALTLNVLCDRLFYKAIPQYRKKMSENSTRIDRKGLDYYA